MTAEKSAVSLGIMFQYLLDTFLFLVPSVAFLVTYLVIVWLIAYVVGIRRDYSHIAPAGSAFVVSYISSLGGSYSIWPSLLLIGTLIVLGSLLIERRVDFRELVSTYRWQGLTFCAVYIVCTNYFLRAFNP